MQKSKPIQDFFTDALHRTIYATDASVYRHIPKAVAYPKDVSEIKSLIRYAQKQQLTLTPRAGGTSLGGQCVSDGIIVDISRHFTKIISFDKGKKQVVVQPGVIRDQLNDFLKEHGLFFAPNTSTTNRCTIGGMVGNNSSGSSSIQYGVTRDKVVRLSCVLSDASEAVFESVKPLEFHKKTRQNNLEGKIYKKIHDLLQNEEVQNEILREFPKQSIHRRNNGYAVDALIQTNVFGENTEDFNLCKLISGSEGTLAFITEITLQLDELPPPHRVMVATHFSNMPEALKAVVVAMKHQLYMCELMDKVILDQTKSNRTQAANRSFVEGDPQAILLLEVAANTQDDALDQSEKLIADLQSHHMGYAYPKLFGKDIDKAINLRAAGLGLLGNMIGDNKAVACIEDTAVALEDLPDYIDAFDELMRPLQQKFVYFAHAGAGELHLRPILNLKKSKDVRLFYEITEKVAHLVKKFNGSLSGEHGDGIVRAGFLPIMIGEKNYNLLKEIKFTFDPENIFNKGKIVEAPPMTENLRYKPDRIEPEIETIYDFSDSFGILRATEKCNGSGDCRKLPASGGTMCPSYRATRNEKDTTRARANALREFLTNSGKSNPFNHRELYDVFDLCLSCKACASECPSNVDVATLKAEFLYQYQKENGIPFRNKIFAHNASLNKLGSLTPRFTNLLLSTKAVKKLMGIAQKRSIPPLAKTTFARWLKQQPKPTESSRGKLVLFIDEYTNYYDVQTGKDTYHLLTKLGYEVQTLSHPESGRSYISKGLLDKAREIAEENVSIFKDIISETLPLVGIEPSTILSFKDEYIRLVKKPEEAEKIAQHVYTVEGFFEREYKKGVISAFDFTDLPLKIHIHGHCHQKSIDGMKASEIMMQIPENYEVRVLDTGCCGMAGSFGYEAEHYEISMQVGEDSLFPAVRKIETGETIVAAGTSCRHQILDGTRRKALHPASVLLKAVK